MPSMARHMTAGGLAGLGLFQLSLAAGAPWGHASYGGAYPGVLPPRLRVISAGAFLAYSGLTGAVVSPRVPVKHRRKLLTGVTGVMGLAAIVNGLSPSAPERALWAPISALLSGTAWRARRDGV